MRTLSFSKKFEFSEEELFFSSCDKNFKTRRSGEISLFGSIIFKTKNC